MNIIVKKVRLVAGPVPRQFGTDLTVEVPEELPEFGIATATLAEGHSSLTVSWGDGEETIVTDAAQFPLIHPYAAPDRYTIHLSDDISMLAVSDVIGSAVEAYKPFLIALRSDAQVLTSTGEFCCHVCSNLAEFDIRNSSIVKIGRTSMKNCVSLPARLYFPNVNVVEGGGLQAPFKGCTSVMEIHFAKANEEAITSSPDFAKSPTLGAPNATLFFDL